MRPRSHARRREPVRVPMKANLSSRVRQVSANLIGQSRLHIIDTEGGTGLSQFCAISCTGPVSRSECLNLYNLQTHRSRPSKKGTPGGAVSYGNWLPLPHLLIAIKEYFRRCEQSSLLVAHSAISADSCHLTTNLMLHYQQQRERNHTASLGHSRVVGYIDTLPLFKALYPSLPSYKQVDLVRYFLGVSSYNAHNALDDSLMLFSLWNKYIWPLTKNNLDLLSQASVSNLYCVDRYLAKSRYSFKANHLNNFRSKKDVSRPTKSKVTLFQTKSLLYHLYPMLHNYN